MEWIWYIIAALGAGIGTGLAGLSAATVMVPILIVLCPSFAGETGAYQATAIALASDILGSAVGTSTFIMIFTALIASASHILIHPVILLEKWDVMLLSIIVATAASLCSARFANRVDNRTVGLVTGAVLTALGGSMLLLHFWPQISTVPLAVQTLACIGRLIHTVWQTQDQDPVCSQVMGGHAGHVRGGLSLRYVRAALLRWARHGSGCGCRPPGRDCGGRDGAVLSKRMGHGDCSRGDTARVDCGHMNAQNGNSKSFTKGFASGMIVQDGLW